MELSGRITRLRMLKNRSFAICDTDDGPYELVMDSATARTLVLDSFVRVAGVRDVYRGTAASREHGGERRVAVDEVRSLGVPSGLFHERVYMGRGRLNEVWRRIVRARCVKERRLQVFRDTLIREIETVLDDKEYSKVVPPIIRRSEACSGNSRPFTVRDGSEELYLSVCNLDVLRRVAACHPGSYYCLSPLFWNHSYDSKQCLNEILLLEFCIARSDLEALKTATRDLVARVMSRAAEYVGARSDHVGTLCSDAAHIPEIEYSRVRTLLHEKAIIPIDRVIHELPRRVDGIIGDWVKSPIYWINGGDLEGQPEFVNITDGGVADACELRVLGAGEVASGSTWKPFPATDASRLSRAESGADNVDARGAGMSLGVDRLLSGVLGIADLAELSLFPLRGKRFPFSSSAPLTDNSRSAARKHVRSAPKPRSSRGRAYAYARLTEKARGLALEMTRRGFHPLRSAYLTDETYPSLSPRSSPIAVDYFGMSVFLRESLFIPHLIAASTDRYETYEMAPVYRQSATGRNSHVTVFQFIGIWRLERNAPWSWDPNSIKEWLLLFESVLSKSVYCAKERVTEGTPPPYLRVSSQIAEVPLSEVFLHSGASVGWHGEIITSVADWSRRKSRADIGADVVFNNAFERIIQTGVPPLGCLMLEITGETGLLECRTIAV